jgi:hypothetical protein
MKSSHNFCHIICSKVFSLTAIFFLNKKLKIKIYLNFCFLDVFKVTLSKIEFSLFYTTWWHLKIFHESQNSIYFVYLITGHTSGKVNNLLKSFGNWLWAVFSCRMYFTPSLYYLDVYGHKSFWTPIDCCMEGGANRHNLCWVLLIFFVIIDWLK